MTTHTTGTEVIHFTVNSTAHTSYTAVCSCGWEADREHTTRRYRGIPMDEAQGEAETLANEDALDHYTAVTGRVQFEVPA